MNVFIVILIFFSHMSFAKELNVLWWNIGGNRYSDDRGDYTNLDETFENRDFSKFDLVALGEFIPDSMAPEKFKNLLKNFPFQKKFSYPATNRKIYILSKYNFASQVYPLDWFDRSMSTQEIEKFKQKTKDIQGAGRMASFPRFYQRITLVLNQKPYHFIFYHLNNPWPGIIAKFGKIRAASEILLGQKNPLMYQIKHFKQVMLRDLGVNYKNKNVIVMGDSNCPLNVKGLRSACNQLMRQTLPLVLDHARLETFPAPHYREARKFPKVKIDHAQASHVINVKEFNVLEDWEGSDHLPIHLSLEI